MKAATPSDLLTRLEWPGSSKHLALVRIAVCMHVALVLMSPAYDLIFTVPGHLMPWAKTVLPESVEYFVAEHFFVFAQVGLLAAVCAMLGFLTRASLIVTALCFFLTQNFWFRMSLFHDDWLYFNAYLCVLAFSPCADSWSVDAWLRTRRGLPAAPSGPQHRLAIELMILWFAGVYVAAGLAKIFPLIKVPGWLSGARCQDFAQEFLLDSPIYWLTGGPAFDYSEHAWPFALAAVFTLFAELGAATLVLTDRFRWLMLPAIVGMHAGIWLLGIPGFVQAAFFSLSLFVPAQWLERGARMPGRA
jgi:hypothetical protein